MTLPLPERRIVVVPEDEVPHPACIWGAPLPDDLGDMRCEEHEDRAAVVVLYYPTRYACVECVKEFENG